MDKNKQLKMGAKFLWTASLILILISCQSEKKEIKIRFTANEKNYEISAKDKIIFLSNCDSVTSPVSNSFLD